MGTGNELAAMCRNKSRPRTTLLSRMLRAQFVFPVPDPAQPQGLRSLDDLRVLDPRQPEAAAFYPRMAVAAATVAAEADKVPGATKKPARKRAKK